MLILHLSDIHFRKQEVGTVQDPNFHLRHELVLDVVEQCDRLGPPDAIVISGDVAFAGDPDEFTFATNWLRDLCNACGCPTSAVFVVPGNHDVVRSSADHNLVQMVHESIKRSDNPAAEITRQLRDPEACNLLYRSLDNYNQFAGQFFCSLLPPERTRAKRDLKMNDGSTLRLWGLNTSFVSSSRDQPRSLFVDTASMQIPRETGVVNLVIAHHHLSWLAQARELEDHLNHVACLQMFGHVHTNRVEMNRDYFRLTASAANPDRHEQGWEPGYNLVELAVQTRATGRMLDIKAHVRVWQTGPDGFFAKRDKMGVDYFAHTLTLGSWRPPAAPASVPDMRTPSTIESEAIPVGEGDVMDTLRDLGLRFYRLSFNKKSEIAGRLDLLQESDMRLPDHERFRLVIIRAHERCQLDALRDAVYSAEQG
ncbi:metallophosphoesterase [Pseudomonas syringae]|uniref:metallophosphoesterase n=1 Tax=Pseudomonas TaxID=286 RepID=UPI0007301A48|nr:MULTISPECIES: metallophosphoesterase [Pseudomonas]KTC09411.1 metallophosphoesterase [Pseudomonas syringae ICMP 11168]MBP1086783.1 putative phosphodiesterase [Pseudomonas sp. PvP007]MBP1141529.1 putative phosphodiesterase [Pseudomonas sp. PvP009]MBP1192180.1 putative phosphodiesterase [Pseudomonas sp. PvP100]MCF5653110.1 metallophosphoesterase [Pseudomonas syringae]